MADAPSSNRGHRGFHRGRRGPDRRGSERTGDRGPDRGADRSAERRQQPGTTAAQTENADVAEIMRDIRARIAQRHGINLTDQQVDELAARRLEAILDVRAVSPDLMEQLRRAAGSRSVSLPAPPDMPAYTFEADTLYETPRGLLRSIRRLLNPLLKLLFNPEPLVMALNLQSRLNTEAAVRESERTERQAEWNALHYALLQRLVTEIARLSLETQHLGQQVESLSARVDFNDRRVRTIEGGVHQSEVRAAASTPSPVRQESASLAPSGGGGDQALGEGGRRKRRRRRGRRPGGPDLPPTAGGPLPPASMDDGDDAADDSPDTAGAGELPGQESGFIERERAAAPGQELPVAAAPLEAEGRPQAPGADAVSPGTPEDR